MMQRVLNVGVDVAKDVVVVAIDPLFPANILAGTKGDAVYKNYDGGNGGRRGELASMR